MFGLFILLNLILFLRPGEIVPGLRAAPLYQVTILACLVGVSSTLPQLLSGQFLRQNPVSACVTAVLVAAPLSFLGQGLGQLFYFGQLAFEDFGKTYLYFLVATAVLTSAERVERMLVWLTLMIGVVAALSLAHDRGLLVIPELAAIERSELDESGQKLTFTQLRGTGIFNDPNDLAMLLTVGFVVAVHTMSSPWAGAARPIAIAVAALCVLGIFETKSRGGALGFLAAGWVMVYARWGMSKAVLAAAGMAPVALAIFAMREGGGSVTEGTALHRIQLWSEGLKYLKWNPLFGVGYDRFAAEIGLVAHNSFVHCFTELGFFGGAFFLGAFVAAGIGLRRVWQHGNDYLPPANRARIATVAACLVGYTTAMLTLSRGYVVPTYLILALAARTAAIEQESLHEEGVQVDLPQFDGAFLWTLAKASFAFLLAIYLFAFMITRLVM